MVHEKDRSAMLRLTRERIHFLLFITRKYTVINANLELINAKIHSFYLLDIHLTDIIKFSHHTVFC